MQDEHRIEVAMGNLLRAGVVLAGSVVAVGGIVFLVHHGSAPPDHHAFHSEPSDLRTLGGIARDAIALTGRGLIQFGLLLLIATPIARVAFSAYAFARGHDRKYVVITIVVLAILAYSLIGGKG
jgi:uncharacterized membrane protein